MKKTLSSLVLALSILLSSTVFAFQAQAGATYTLRPVVIEGTSATITIDIAGGDPSASYYVQVGEVTAPGVCTPDSRMLSPGQTIHPGGEFINYGTPPLSVGTTYCAGIATRATLVAANPTVIQYFADTFTLTSSVVTAPATTAGRNDCGAAGVGCYHLLAPLPGVGFNGNVSTGKDCVLSDGTVLIGGGLGCYVRSIIKLIIGLVTVLAVLMVVIGGIEYMMTTSAGEKNGSKSRITNALFGLLLAVSAYLILNTLNPNLVNLNITVPGASLTLDENVYAPTAGTGVSSPTPGKPDVTGNITSFDQYLSAASKQYGVECTLAKAIMYRESSGNPMAMSTYTLNDGTVGHAYGLMQLTPATYQSLGGTGTITDAQSNINAGVKYIAQLTASGCNGSSSNAVCSTKTPASNNKYVIAGYNSGALRNSPSTSCKGITQWECTVNDRLQQTRDYVSVVQANYQALTSKGFTCQ